MLGWNPSRSLYIAVTVLQTLADSTETPKRPAATAQLPSASITAPPTLDKRAQFVNQKFTFYDGGLYVHPRIFHLPESGSPAAFRNACGSFTQPSDFGVAMRTDQFGDGSSCGKQITITANESTTTATCTDVCAGCSSSELDFTRGLFEFFTGGNLEVALIGSWSFLDIAQRMLPEQFTNTEEHVSQDGLRLKTGSLLTQPVPVVAENDIDVLPHTNVEDGEGTVSLRLRRMEAQMETLLTMGFPEGSPPSYAG
ncbi:hypothetical protein B0H14DRAFT_3471635 [Mycena olivaceomarginata]|nr:hypothetical protein B0H14DRAFT_3471635 [Mycena olivaceomarginata]